MLKHCPLIKSLLNMSSSPISYSLHAKNNPITDSSFFKETNGKIIGISILVLGLILVLVTALSLPSITPIWSPLIPLGVLVISIIIFCILSKSQPIIQKKESPKKIEEDNLSTTSTRKNSLSSLLEEETNSFNENEKLYKSDSSSSINTLLSEAINQAFLPHKKEPSLILEIDNI